MPLGQFWKPLGFRKESVSFLQWMLKLPSRWPRTAGGFICSSAGGCQPASCLALRERDLFNLLFHARG